MSKHVLIVDDDAKLTKIIKYIVEQMPDTTAQTAGSGPMALKCIGEKRPDLLVLDIMLPRMDGGAVCRRLRADLVTARLPVLIISGHQDVAQIARDSGATDYLPKPFSLGVLEQRIQAMLVGGECPPGTWSHVPNQLEVEPC